MTDSATRVMVAGATGYLGKFVVQAFKERGYWVRALTRDEDRLVGLDERTTGASGCSIDALMGRLGELEREFGFGLTDASPVWYRDGEGHIRSVTREDFRKLADSGTVGPETPVFDLTASSLGPIRSSGLERPASTSWHARLL